VIVKPTDGAGSRGVKMCEDENCVQDQIESIFTGTEVHSKEVRLA
jgi:biotin carboxylase